MKYPVVKVDWIDPCTDTSWRRADSKIGFASMCTSIGIMLEDTPDHVVVCLSYCGEMDIDECDIAHKRDGRNIEKVTDSIIIPRRCVFSVSVIVPSDEEKKDANDIQPAR